MPTSEAILRVSHLSKTYGRGLFSRKGHKALDDVSGKLFQYAHQPDGSWAGRDMGLPGNSTVQIVETDGTVLAEMAEGLTGPYAILAEAAECGANLIVLGTHGRKGLRRAIVGSVAGAVAAMAIGSAWYSPWLFANRWQALIGKTPEEMGNPVTAMAVAFLMFLLMGFGMSWIIPNDSSVGIGMMWGFIGFWGFALPTTVINGVFERRPWSLMAIYLGYLLVSMLVMAAIISFLGG